MSSASLWLAAPVWPAPWGEGELRLSLAENLVPRAHPAWAGLARAGSAKTRHGVRELRFPHQNFPAPMGCPCAAAQRQAKPGSGSGRGSVSLTTRPSPPKTSSVLLGTADRRMAIQASVVLSTGSEASTAPTKLPGNVASAWARRSTACSGQPCLGAESPDSANLPTKGNHE